MTLVIAGYSSGDFEHGLYFSADGNITRDRDVLVVDGFKKIIELPIRLKALNFCGDWFNGYHGNRYESSCVIAFAGSVVFANHFINSIRNHLSELYPTLRDGEYQAVMPCEHSKHLKKGDTYDDSMFLDIDLDGIITGKYLSQVVLHSIEFVLKRLRSRALTSQSFIPYQTEFIFGVQCPATREYELYEYEVLLDDTLGIKVICSPILENELAIIGGGGMKEEIKASAMAVLNQCSDEEKVSHTMFSFLNETIDAQNALGNKFIGKPSVLYNLEVQTLKKIKIQN